MHRPKTVEGLQAWDIALRSVGQMRALPGVVIGFDMTAVFAIGAALGVASTALAELLPPIEAAAIREMNKRSGDDG